MFASGRGNAGLGQIVVRSVLVVLITVPNRQSLGQ